LRPGALRAGLWSVALACGLLLLPLVHPMGHAPLAMVDSTKAMVPGLTFEVRDGLLTATLPDGADDTVLAAALPSLMARGVRAVSLHGAPIRDITPLAQLPGLLMLDAAGTRVRDLTPLAGLTGLQSLNLQFAPVHDLTPLAGHAALRSLNLNGTDVRELAPLADLTALQDLSVAVTKIDDLSPLARLRALASLDASGTLVSDASPLANLLALRVLNLNGTQVTDLRPLSGLANLQRLDVGGTQVSDVRPLAGLRNLHWLDLEATQVADVASLSSITTLRFLALGGSRVRTITLPEHILAGESAIADRPAPPMPDPVLYWNDQTNRAIQVTETDPFQATRDLAMESLAVLDTVRSLSGKPAFLVRLPPPVGVSMRIAVTSAAHTMLTHLFPDDATVLDAALAAALAAEPVGPARDRALAFGKSVAEALVMRREDDGASKLGESRVGTAPGQWRPTPPAFLPAMDPQWATLAPFALTAPQQFRPVGPPDLNSAAYRQARATVAAVGGAHSTVRTAEQTEIAHYWSDAIGTYAPAGHWNAIAAGIVAPIQLGMAAEAELFAELNVAIADSSIAMADAKYTYWSWRPITTIRTGDDVTAPQPSWTPLLTTPNHPSYVSGHSTFSGAAATVLTQWFGVRPFTFASASLPGVTRDFTSFQQAAEEAAASRVYGGIHFPFDNADGLTIGRQVGAWTLGVFQRLDQERGPYLMVGGPMDMMVAMDKAAIVGCALDNVAPVAMVTAQLDGGTPFSVPVDDQGLFTLPSSRIDPSGRHDLVLAATSTTGRTTTVRLSVGPQATP
jgi:Leucine-rich repeat (LRR) protein/membrane-associated phospholipid phosphatase